MKSKASEINIQWEFCDTCGDFNFELITILWRKIGAIWEDIVNQPWKYWHPPLFQVQFLPQNTMPNCQRPPLWGSTRLTLVILCFNCAVIMMVLRFNFSMAIVCMTGEVKANSTNTTLVFLIGWFFKKGNKEKCYFFKKFSSFCMQIMVNLQANCKEIWMIFFWNVFDSYSNLK